MLAVFTILALTVDNTRDIRAIDTGLAVLAVFARLTFFSLDDGRRITISTIFTSYPDGTVFTIRTIFAEDKIIIQSDFNLAFRSITIR